MCGCLFCQKWNSSSAPVLCLRAQWSLSLSALFHCPIFSFRAPPSHNLTHLLPFLWLPTFLSPVFFRHSDILFFSGLSPIYRIFHYSLPLSLSLSFLINISITLSFPTCLSLFLSPPSITATVEERFREHYQPSVPLVCLQGKQLWWGLMHYWSLSSFRIYLLMHNWHAHTHKHTSTEITFNTMCT